MEENKKEQSFWRTLPGLLTGCAAVMTALASCAGVVWVIYRESEPTRASAPNSPPITLTSPAPESVTPPDSGITSLPVTNPTVITPPIATPTIDIPPPPTNTECPTYHSYDFEGVVAPEWSTPITHRTPIGNRGFLGDFVNERVTLSLDCLPIHSLVTLSFDLFIIRSWDGHDGGPGPDIWMLEAEGIGMLLKTTFCNYERDNPNCKQAYPGSYGETSYPPLRNALEINSLGYIFGDKIVDAVYHLSYPFRHTGSSLVLHFSASGLEGSGNESWGLDNVDVIFK